MALITHDALAGVGVTHSGEGLVERASALFTTWKRRTRERLELARMTDRELRDIGINKLEAMAEYEKPFWRA